jgi:alkyldihydroxyacetonephosphate synthase
MCRAVARASVTPFGGGSSVVGGVEPTRDAARHKGAVTVDLRELGCVLEVDKTSRAARIEAVSISSRCAGGRSASAY